MEKNAAGRTGKLCTGLLILFCLFSADLFGLTRSQQIRQLRVIPDEQIFFTAQENGYTLTIPGVEPAQVQSELPSLPLGIQFVSSRKDEYMDTEGNRGTTIQLWFTFSETGPVKMPALGVLVSGKSYYIPFEDVTVYENPAIISPQLFVSFKEPQNITVKGGRNILNGRTGVPIVFTVYIKYCVQITNFSWNIPLNSIFREIKRYDITNEIPRGAGFSTESFPIATFEWIPLVEGEYSLPQVNISATAYNGSRKQVYLPEYEVKISANEASVEQDSSLKTLYKDAFAEIPEEKTAVQAYVPTRKDCEELAILRSKERNSIFWSSARKSRIEFENSLEFKATVNEPSIPLVYLILSITLLFLLNTVSCLLLKHYRTGVLFIFLSLMFLSISISAGSKLFPKYGIFVGGTVNSIPEEKTSSSHQASAGLRVRILGKTNDWYYISTRNADGWVKTDMVYPVR